MKINYINFAHEEYGKQSEHTVAKISLDKWTNIIG